MRGFGLIAAVALAGLGLAGCATQRGVVGPGQGYALGLWSEGRWRHLNFRTASGAMQTATEQQARERWSLEGRWMLCEYRLDPSTSDEAAAVVEELRAIDGRSGIARLDEVIAAAQQADRSFTADQVASVPAAPGVTRLGEKPVPQSTVTAVRLAGDELIVSTEAGLVVQAMQRPCGGSEMAPVLTAVDGVMWARAHRVRLDGAVLEVTSSGPRRVTAPQCDPRAPSAPEPALP